ncbi:MAG TPA: UDP-N-acetylmuramoyl-L-alanine--D-glutamate ligase [Smithellaceae bacterium]|nr:UDP-N-acetylmuramoyl-L-alanine--D-glutamate ligase [Smithellaceae bacterium]HRS89591.1 UDP-N-acetylmuramoyl-L-alanine--D-glutamate ligase [Smithellaceae bacterium]HRV26348.1 UDP-N-acetylmuramoyl-L-alanine--D-glutamate ligase [Smithellaceae bacterium]
MDLKNKKILVLGVGKTGIATAKFLAGQGAKITLTDEKPLNNWGTDFEQIARESWLKAAAFDPAALDDVTMVIPSPGFPPHNALLLEALKRKIPVMSEIELAYRFIKTPLIAITGTNGKTTTTTLVGEILKKSGKNAFVGGNIGNPLIEYAAGAAEAEIAVAEISSFQLQWVEEFHPFVATLLNVTSDHINYHGSFEAYLKVKSRIFARQTKDDFAVLNADDPALQGLIPDIRARIALFSSARELPEGMFLRNKEIIFQMRGFAREIYPLSIIKLPGLHNVENVMAAIMSARFCGIEQESIKSCIAAFRGLPHRLEFAGEKNAVKFYDDSKGTNVGSVIRALETFPAAVILLLGGRDKNGDFDALKTILPRKVKKVILFGEARERIDSLIGSSVEKIKKSNLGDAIQEAYKNAAPGDIVLLSPGCASFDEFRDYKERGEFFKKAVRNL